MRLFLLLGVTLLTTIQASSPILLSSKRSIFTSNSLISKKNTLLIPPICKATQLQIKKILLLL